MGRQVTVGRHWQAGIVTGRGAGTGRHCTGMRSGRALPPCGWWLPPLGMRSWVGHDGGVGPWDSTLVVDPPRAGPRTRDGTRTSGSCLGKPTRAAHKRELGRVRVNWGLGRAERSVFSFSVPSTPQCASRRAGAVTYPRAVWLPVPTRRGQRGGPADQARSPPGLGLSHGPGSWRGVRAAGQSCWCGHWARLQ